MNNTSQDFIAERMYRERFIIDQASRILMPFGKHQGKAITEVPLKYLDETISTMPQTWLVRRVREFVDVAMQHTNAPDEPGQCSFDEIEEEWQRKAAEGSERGEV